MDAVTATSLFKSCVGKSDDTEYGKVSYVRFHMLFGFRPASGRESVPLVCPRCRL